MAIGIEITLDPSQVVRGADQVDKALDDIASSAENAQKILIQFENTKLGNISSSLESVKNSSTATVSALSQLKGAFDNLAESLKKTGNEENTTTNKTDALIQSLQRQIQLAKLTGVEAEKLKNSWKLGADASETQRYAVEKLTEQLARLKDAANDTDESGGGASGGLSGITDAIGGVVGAGKLLIGLTIGSKVAEWAKEFITTADTINLMQSRLKQFVETGESTDALFSQIQMSANAAGTSLESTLSVFGQFAKAGQDMGLSNDQVLKLISNLQKMALVSGASSEAAAAAIYQLSQSFASGVLQGDEFRSVSEQMPAVLDNLAKKLNVTRGELRKMASDGKIGQEQLALLAGEFTEVDTQAAKLPRTVEQASTALMNNLSVAADALNDKLGLSQGVAGTIDKLNAILELWTKNLNGTATESDYLQDSLTRQKESMAVLQREYDAAVVSNTNVNKVIGGSVIAYNNLENPQQVRIANLKAELDQIKSVIAETENQINVYSRLGTLASTLVADLKAAQQPVKAPKPDADAAKAIKNLQDQLTYTKALAAGNYELAASTKLGTAATKDQVAEYAAALKAQTEYSNGLKQSKKATSEAESAAKREQKQLEQNQEANKKYIKTLTDKVNAGQFDVQRAKEQVAQSMLQGQSVDELTSSYLKSVQVQNQLTLQSKQAEAQSRLNADATDAQRQAVDAYVASLYKQEQAKQLANQVTQVQNDVQAQLNPLGNQYSQVGVEEANRLAVIKQWRDQFRADDLEAEQQYQDMKTQIQQAGDQQRNDLLMAANSVLLSATGDFFGAMADVLKNAKGEQSAIYKSMFLASKAFAIASATISLWQNVSKAMSVGFPMNIPFIAGALAQGTAILQNISSVQTAGFAQGGYVSGMGTGTSDSIPARLSNGEYVMPARQTRQYRNELAAMRAGSYNGGSGSNMNVKVDNYGGERVQVQQLTADDVRIIVGQEVPRVNEREFNNPYSRTNKAYKTNYEATRKT